MIRLKYDLSAGALYIKVSDQPIARTRDIDDNTSVDLDVDGVVVGIEVISITHPWALGPILENYPIPQAETAQLRAYFVPAPKGIQLEAPELQGIRRQEPELNIERNAPVCAVA
jgi:uncharacterized protein YuzE